ncbi:MAG: hypothetical protein K2X93_02415 [Candidatus Obscuribacterales bacterium]|nr:hypothetical protein [Candidatus Obscuribacterales bacterium]
MSRRVAFGTSGLRSLCRYRKSAVEKALDFVKESREVFADIGRALLKKVAALSIMLL